MPPKKKGKKGKKKTVVEGPQPITTVQIIQDRTKMLCPRMGDIYSRALNVEGILEVQTAKVLFILFENESPFIFTHAVICCAFKIIVVVAMVFFSGCCG